MLREARCDHRSAIVAGHSFSEGIAAYAADMAFNRGSKPVRADVFNPAPLSWATRRDIECGPSGHFRDAGRELALKHESDRRNDGAPYPLKPGAAAWGALPPGGRDLIYGLGALDRALEPRARASRR